MQEKDIESVLKMAKDLHDESPHYQSMSYDQDKVYGLLNGINDSNQYNKICSFIAEKDDIIIGVAICFVAERFFNDEKYLVDLAIYVKPEYRGSSVFLKFIKKVENFAFEQNIKTIIFGVSTEIDANKTVSLYQRLGYDLTGYVLQKKI